jgi:hypothetical protein
LATTDLGKGAFYNRAALLPMMNLTALPASVDNCMPRSMRSVCGWPAF